MLGTRDCVCTSVRTYSAAAISVAEVCFLARSAAVQLFTQLECVRVCECLGGGHRGVLGGVQTV